MDLKTLENYYTEFETLTLSPKNNPCHKWRGKRHIVKERERHGEGRGEYTASNHSLDPDLLLYTTYASHHTASTSHFVQAAYSSSDFNKSFLGPKVELFGHHTCVSLVRLIPPAKLVLYDISSQEVEP